MFAVLNELIRWKGDIKNNTLDPWEKNSENTKSIIVYRNYNISAEMRSVSAPFICRITAISKERKGIITFFSRQIKGIPRITSISSLVFSWVAFWFVSSKEELEINNMRYDRFKTKYSDPGSWCWKTSISIIEVKTFYKYKYWKLQQISERWK